MFGRGAYITRGTHLLERGNPGSRSEPPPFFFPACVFHIQSYGMFQPEPTAYLPLSTGYGIGHGLPEFTFQETPLGLSGSGGGGGGGLGGGISGSGGGAGAGGRVPGAGGLGGTCGSGGSGYVGIGSGTVGSGNTAGAGTAGGPATTAAAALIYTTPIFSPNTATIGPASGPFSFHTTSSHHNHQQPPHSSHNQTRIKMEPNTDDLAAQEAAARVYQPQIKVRDLSDSLFCRLFACLWAG